jgi:hypothetical protein
LTFNRVSTNGTLPLGLVTVILTVTESPTEATGGSTVQPELHIPEDPASWSVDTGAGLMITLVDTANGTVKAWRMAYLSNALSTLLYEAICCQAAAAHDDAAYWQMIGELQSIPTELFGRHGSQDSIRSGQSFIIKLVSQVRSSSLGGGAHRRLPPYWVFSDQS